MNCEYQAVLDCCALTIVINLRGSATKVRRATYLAEKAKNALLMSARSNGGRRKVGGGNTATRRSGMKARSVRAGTCSGKRRPFWLFRGRSRLVDHSSRLLRGPLGRRGWSADWNNPSKCIKLQLSSPREDGGGVVLKTCDQEVSCEPRQVCTWMYAITVECTLACRCPLFL